MKKKKKTSSNVYNVLLANEFFKLVQVEKLCVKFIQSNLPISETLETFEFACLTGKTSLTTILSQFIMRHLDVFHHYENLVDLSFEALNILVNQQWYLPLEHEPHLLDTIAWWVNPSPKSRDKYIDEVLKKTKFHLIYLLIASNSSKKNSAPSCNQCILRTDNNSYWKSRIKIPKYIDYAWLIARLHGERIWRNHCLLRK